MGLINLPRTFVPRSRARHMSSKWGAKDVSVSQVAVSQNELDKAASGSEADADSKRETSCLGAVARIRQTNELGNG